MCLETCLARWRVARGWSGRGVRGRVGGRRRRFLPERHTGRLPGQAAVLCLRRGARAGEPLRRRLPLSHRGRAEPPDTDVGGGLPPGAEHSVASSRVSNASHRGTAAPRQRAPAHPRVAGLRRARQLREGRLSFVGTDRVGPPGLPLRVGGRVVSSKRQSERRERVFQREARLRRAGPPQQDPRGARGGTSAAPRERRRRWHVGGRPRPPASAGGAGTWGDVRGPPPSPGRSPLRLRGGPP